MPIFGSTKRLSSSYGKPILAPDAAAGQFPAITLKVTQIALQDYSDDDDFYGQDFQRQNKVSVWVGLDGSRGEPELDVLQDLCGVGYYRLSDQEHYNFDFAAVNLRDLLAPLSYSPTFIDAAIAAARKRGLEKACWVTVQYDFEYDPLKVKRQIANDPIFIGSFLYSRRRGIPDSHTPGRQPD